MTQLSITKCDGPDCRNEQNDETPSHAHPMPGYDYIMLEGQRYDFHSEACMIKFLVRRREDSMGEAI